MEIVFQGKHNTDEAAESIIGIIRLFKERYQIQEFREMHLSLTLVDSQGEDVELVDSETSEAYRIFEVYRQEEEIRPGKGRPSLKLVIDNTKGKKV